MADAEEYDETPSFIDMASAVEVAVPDEGEPMDDDDKEMAATTEEERMMAGDDMQDEVPDVSKTTMTSHTDAVYAICADYDSESKVLSVVSGAGDDRAYLHFVAANTTNGADAPSVKSISLSHPHTDSISAVSINNSFVNSDVGGKPQRKLVAVGSYDGAIVLYDAGDGSLVKVLEGPSDVEWCCFHPKGGTVLLAGSIADGTIWMYHTPSFQCLQVFVGHENGGVTAGAFTPDGKWVISAGQDGTIRVWAPKTGMSKHVFRLMDNNVGDEGPGAGLTCLAVGGGADGQLAIAGGEDGNAYVVHIQGKKVVATLAHFEESTGAAAAVPQANDNDGMEEDEEGEARSVEAVGFCPANIPGTAHWCATAGVDGVLKIWNLNVGGGAAQLRQKCIREDVKSGITRLRWHNSLPLVLASYTDGCVCIWDVRTGTIVQTLTGHEDMINDMDVCFVAGSATSVVVTGSDDKSVKVFEFSPSS